MPVQFFKRSNKNQGHPRPSVITGPVDPMAGDKHIPFGNFQSDVFLPLRAGMQYAALYGARPVPVPNVPPMIRQSFAQVLLRHKWQISRYISPLSRPMSPLPLIDYPGSHTQKIINTRPIPNQRPILQNSYLRTPSTAAGGTIGPLPRFAKALPYPLVNYNPPIY